MRLKNTVSLINVQPQTAIGMAIADHVYKDITGNEMTVTSCNDGIHKDGSLHDAGKAFDARSKTLTDSQKDVVLTALRRALGPEWDVILESRGQLNEHYHLEWDVSVSAAPVATVPV